MLLNGIYATTPQNRRYLPAICATWVVQMWCSSSLRLLHVFFEELMMFICINLGWFDNMWWICGIYVVYMWYICGDLYIYIYSIYIYGIFGISTWMCVKFRSLTGRKWHGEFHSHFSTLWATLDMFGEHKRKLKYLCTHPHAHAYCINVYNV